MRVPVILIPTFSKISLLRNGGKLEQQKEPLLKAVTLSCNNYLQNKTRYSITFLNSQH